MDLVKVLPAADFDKIAIGYLEIKHNELAIHEKNNKNNYEMYMFNVLMSWVKKHDSPDIHQKLHDKLSKAVDNGLVPKDGIAFLLFQSNKASDFHTLDVSEGPNATANIQEDSIR